jgi:hypothetical protein
MNMSCPLCDNVMLHNTFCQLHRGASPRAPSAAKALGVTVDEVLKHRRHTGAFTAIIPIPLKDEENVKSSDVNPLQSLHELKSTLTSLLTQIRYRKDINAGDIVRVTSEIRSLITTSEDLQIKLAAAKGSENSAFTQAEMQRIFNILKNLSPEHRSTVCEMLNES